MYLCANNYRCADKLDGIAREVNGPNEFCERCLQRITERVHHLPTQYVALHAIIGDRHAGLDTGIRRAKPGSAIPLNLHVDTLMGDIRDTTTMAAEIICDRWGLRTNPTRLDECCTIIAWNLDRLLAVEAVDVMFWYTSGTAHGVSSTTGPLLVGRLDALASLAHFTLGQTYARAKRDLPCTRCRARTVGRWAGNDEFDCTTCGSRFAEDDLRRQDKILAAMAKRGLVEVA